MESQKRSFNLLGIKKTLPGGRAEISDFWQQFSQDGTLEKLVTISRLDDPHFYGISIMGEDSFQYIIGVDTLTESQGFTHFEIPEANWYKFSGGGKLPDNIQNMQEQIWQEHGEEIARNNPDHSIQVNIEEYFNMTPDMSDSNFIIWLPKSKIKLDGILDPSTGRDS
ncbi:GyrI-like domain-containing protein [Companilactobacillus mishanensis]|uniref:GyrI-like domain-containing protein n=1 Tax=Companilactobacillus mishanensis TaxID=2486008 RepID=A0A5P0ZGB8_9LACO|nr:GyrI-like domain-containing protein [Companilactobacillus mishanensis]MQS52096.1 GyrI-like domain-containing protein [Companilactobacillus mishanensis]